MIIHLYMSRLNNPPQTKTVKELEETKFNNYKQ